MPSPQLSSLVYSIFIVSNQKQGRVNLSSVLFTDISQNIIESNSIVLTDGLPSASVIA